MSERVGKFVTGSTMSHVIRMTVTGAIGVTFMFLIDAANLFWVSLLGVERLIAALGFAWTVQFFSISIGLGLMIATTARVSLLIGRNERADARRQASVCAISSFTLQLVAAFLIVSYRHEILRLLGAQGQVELEAARYLLISVPALPLLSLGMIGSGVLRAEGDAYRAMMVTLASGLVSMLIDPVLIFALGLGLDGAAIASVVARVLSASLSIYFVLHVHDLAGKIGWGDFKRLARPFALVAVPVILTQLSTPFGNFILTSVIAGFGDSAMAGWAVVARLAVLTFGGLFALSGAIGGIFGQNFGAGRFDRVRTTYRDALIFCLSYTVIAWILLAMATSFVTRTFGLSDEAARMVRAFTSLAAAGYMFTGALFVANAAFNNLGRAGWSTLFNWSRDGVLVWPLALGLSGWFGAAGAIYGQALAGAIVGVFAASAGWVFVSKLALRSVPVRNATLSR